MNTGLPLMASGYDLGGKIDFAFMETFISAIKKLAIKDVVKYSNEKINATKKVVSGG